MTTGVSELRLAGGRVLMPDLSEQALDVVIAEGRITAIAQAGEAIDTIDTIDVSGQLVAPGFIDLQLNGGWGHDFTSEPGSIGAVANRLPESGVTAFLPTIVTSAPEARRAALDALAGNHQVAGAAIPLGLHFEGPSISPNRLGAHDARWVGPLTAGELQRWTRANGVALVTLAPETDGAREMIDALVANGVTVSAGHSECSAAEFERAARAGVSMVTHLFNAMSPFSHREPGLVAATLAGDTFAGLICDGIHVDPVAIRAAWRALGAGRTVLVTDAMAALGIDGADARLGDLHVTVGETGVRTPGGVLAGSNLTLDRAVRNLVEFTGCSAADAVRTVTVNPAAVLGLTDRGVIEVGARADLVVLDPGLRVRMTIIGGLVAWKS